MKLGFLRQVMWGGWKKFGEKNGWSRYPQRIHLGSNHNGKHFKTRIAIILLNSKEISKNMAKFNLCSVGVDLRGSKWLVCGWGLKMWDQIQIAVMQPWEPEINLRYCWPYLNNTQERNRVWNIICPEVDESGFNYTVLGDNLSHKVN